jgi:hypothetical protein
MRHLPSLPGDDERKEVSMTDRPGKRLGQQGRAEIAALTDDELAAMAAAHDVSMTNDDGTPIDREEVVNEVANKVRKAARQAAREAGEDVGDEDDEPVEGETPTA